MTEDEAKNKWCPFARVPSINGITVNRFVEDEFDKTGNCKTYPASGARCLASDCMAWRKMEADKIVHETLELPGAEKPPPGLSITILRNPMALCGAAFLRLANRWSHGTGFQLSGAATAD